jgi:hypothetical protein
LFRVASGRNESFEELIKMEEKGHDFRKDIVQTGSQDL